MRLNIALHYIPKKQPLTCLTMPQLSKNQTSFSPATLMNRTYSSNSITKKKKQQHNINHLNNVHSNIQLSHLNVSSTTSLSNIATSPLNKKREINLINQRLDLGILIEELTSILGKDNWIKYAQFISHFILGKLSRPELLKSLNQLFTADTTLSQHRLTRLHNQLLLGIFANSLRDSPMNQNDKSWGFQNGKPTSSFSSNKISKRVNKHNSQIEIYKKIVMSLPFNDRTRLKSISRESGKRGFIYCTVLQNRLNNVPRIPIVTNPDTLKRVKRNNLKTPLEWSQDIVNGFNAPLATDVFALPDKDSLFLRMTGIAREHGLVGTVDSRCVDMVSIALDHYLKSLIDIGIDSVRYRRKKYSEYYDLNDEGVYVPMTGLGDDLLPLEEEEEEKEMSTDNTGDEPSLPHHPKISLTNEDIQNTLTIFPNLVQPTTGLAQGLTSTGLYNDDDLVIMKSKIDDLPQFDMERPSSLPLDDRNIGSRQELNWLIKDILTEE